MEEKHVTSERGKSRPYKDFSYYNAAEELKDILDVEDIKNVVLAGQSAGGFVAQSFYKKYADMVEVFFARIVIVYVPGTTLRMY